jgi:hypothetical protein
VAATRRSSSPGLRSSPHRWLPGRTTVAPLSSVKGSMAQTVAAPSGGRGRGTGRKPSSGWSSWALSPGLMLMTWSCETDGSEGAAGPGGPGSVGGRSVGHTPGSCSGRCRRAECSPSKVLRPVLFNFRSSGRASHCSPPPAAPPRPLPARRTPPVQNLEPRAWRQGRSTPPGELVRGQAVNRLEAWRTAASHGCRGSQLLGWTTESRPNEDD